MKVEIDKLRQLLRENNIPYYDLIDTRQMRDDFLYGDRTVDKRNQVVIYHPKCPDKIYMTVVCQFRSAGVTLGKLEFYAVDEPKGYLPKDYGYLTANKAFKLIKKKWEEWK